MADFWKDLEAEFKAPQKLQGQVPAQVDNSVGRFAVSPSAVPNAQKTVPITPSLVQPTPPDGSFQTGTNTGLEALDPIKEWQRQQTTESARRVQESTKLQEMRNKEMEDAATHGASAYKTKQILQTLKKLENLPETFNIHTGPLSAPWLAAMQTIKGSLPESISSSDLFPKDQAITSAEALQKLGIVLATASTKELTSRPAVFEFMKNIESNPGLMVRPETRKILTGILEKNADRDIELSKHALRSKDYFEFVKHLDRIHSDPAYEYTFPDSQTNPKKEETKFETITKDIKKKIQ